MIVLSEPDPEWGLSFERERARIAGALGPDLVDAAHVGSTSIPGIAAKPTVDIAVAVGSFGAAAHFVPAIEALGYEYVPAYESSIPNRRYFRSIARGSSGERLFHVHVYESGDPAFADYLIFRDRLRDDRLDAQTYEALKRHLVSSSVSRESYAQEKGPFVRSILARGEDAPLALGPQDVVLVDHDPAWEQGFDAERALLVGALGDRFVRIEHVGSTSIPTICAKPIVDIGATMISIEDVESLVVPLAGAGYLRRADIEANLPPRRFFVKGRGPAGGRFHLHIFRDDNPDFDEMIVFRDWMLAHPAEAKRYDALKREFASTLTRPEYTRAKGPYITDILERARAHTRA